MFRLLPLVTCLVLLGCGPSAGRVVPQPAATPDLDFPVGAFALTERDGRPVTANDLLGKVWVASFVFTRCAGPCPAVTAAVGQLQGDLADQPDVRFVTFTVDPVRDDPAELKKYADRYRADPARWLFLTGKEETIHALMRDRFKLAVAKGGAEAKHDFDHSTRLAVVDKAGVVRATFDGIRDDRLSKDDAEARYTDSLKRLKEKVIQLAAH